MKLGLNGITFEFSQKTLNVSFQIYKLIPQSKNLHTIGETLVKPCLIRAIEEALELEGKKYKIYLY